MSFDLCVFLFAQGPVSIKVAVPIIAEKPEWKLNGQMLSMVLPLTDAVSAIKAKIHEETGLPPGKQKLHYEVIFFFKLKSEQLLIIKMNSYFEWYFVWDLSGIFCVFSGIVLQGFQHFSSLQLDAWYDSSAATERTRRS